MWEINGVDSDIFQAYLDAFSKYKPKEYKIVIIDNAGFHGAKNLKIPDNIFLVNIPPYSPELNPCEKIWHYLKARFKNQHFQDLNEIKEWLYLQLNAITKNQIMSITHNQIYLSSFYTAFNI